MTDAETVLWVELRSHRLGGLKFRRQRIIGPYIVDFICLAENLIIEVDGSQHANNGYDKYRDRWLQDQGFQVVRFWNDNVLRDINGVCQHILALIENKK